MQLSQQQHILPLLQSCCCALRADDGDIFLLLLPPNKVLNNPEPTTGKLQFLQGSTPVMLGREYWVTLADPKLE